MSFTVAILGRPNVGKSTLFNRLVGRRAALVDDTPGVTRDRREGEARLGGRVFTVIDTAGLEEAFDDSLEARMRRQTEQALAQSDVAMMLIDARAGVMPGDAQLARWLRKRGMPVVLVANKCEGNAGVAGLAEAHKLGIGDPVAVSAEHGEGMDELLAALVARGLPVPEDEPAAMAAGDAPTEAAEKAAPLSLVVVGRPNVGKSTLVNRLIGEDRLLTGAEAGITRDAIEVDWQHRGRAVKLIDTAGLRRRAHVVAKLERLSTSDTLKAIRFAHVVVLVVDAGQILEKQDLTIARMVVEEGRALVIAVNKWDSIKDRRKAQADLRNRIEASLPQVKGVAAVPVSALTGHGLDKLMDRVVDAYDVWNRRVPTPQLNRWLEEATARHPPPLVDGRTVKLRYAAQVKIRPPTVQLFASKPQQLPDSYQRYLVNSLREVFDLPGTPIRLIMRKGKNPFVKR